ncbi:parathyroid hormone [Monodelphis domestica]|nr:parathyroid hormone [Monodelphis domestica]XP_056658016.1 parathyroid hormone [Monodelphis domestica]
MVSARDVARAIVVLYVIGFFTNADGKSVKKRVVSEIQLMHDRGENMVLENRLEWLRKKLEDVHTAHHGILRALVAPAEVQLRKRADSILDANEDHQLAPGEKTLGEKDKADVDILSKVNP